MKEKTKSIFVDKQRQKEYNLTANGPVAQLGERSVRIRKVMGSNPTGSTRKSSRKAAFSTKSTLAGG